MRRTLIAVISLVTLAFGLAAPAGADDGADNLVQVRNTQDLATRTRARAVVSENRNPDVTNGNGAVARATCTDCRTVAAAIQVVVVESASVTNYRPENAAVALNESCTRCATFAYARQVVLTPYRDIRIGDRAEGQIEAISREASRVAASDEDFPTMSADLDRLTERLVAVVQAEIDRVGGRGDERSDHRDEREA
jgi:putative peptide zinc metalloprotease protein